MTTSRFSKFSGLVVAVLVLVLVGNAQAGHRDDGDVITCQDAATCFGQDSPDTGPSGDDASNLGGVSDDDGPDLPKNPTDWGPHSAPPVPPSTTTTTATIVTTTTNTTTSAVTTTVAAKTTAAPTPKPPPICSNLPELTAVPATMDRSSNGICTPKCLNHPDFTYLPDRWNKADDGNCYFRGEDNYGLCKGDQYNLVAYSNVDSWLKDGYGMGIIVATPDLQYRLNCWISDLATYHYNPSDYVFSGKYVQDGWPKDFQTFDTPLPYPWSAWKPLYALWVPRATASQYVASQSTTSILAYGLLWYDGNRYQNATKFARYLKHHKTTWHLWRKSYPDLAGSLVAHQTLLRRR